MLLLAQGMPDSQLLSGGVQDILVWVVLAQVALYVATVIFFIKKLNSWEEKYDLLQAKTLKIAIRSQRAIEALADLPNLDVDDEKDKE
jgi:hypothetical protein